MQWCVRNFLPLNLTVLCKLVNNGVILCTMFCLQSPSSLHIPLVYVSFSLHFDDNMLRLSDEMLYMGFGSVTTFIWKSSI